MKKTFSLMGFEGRKMKLSEICAVLEKYKCNSFTEKVVLGLTHDSRKVKEGYILLL